MIKPAMTTKPMTPPLATPFFSPAAKGPAMNALPNACRTADLTAPTAPGKEPRRRYRKALALGLLLGAALLPAAATEALAQPPLTRVQSFTYDPATALLTQQVSEPDLPGIALTTDYTYDGFGNQLTATVSGPDIASRTTSATFSADGRFMETATNALSHSETHVTDPRFGTVTSLTGPNALATTWTYDGFGRKTAETRADGTETRWTYELCVAQCPTGGVYMVTAQDFDSGGFASTAKAIEYLDKLNRVFRSETEGFDGTPVYVDTEYDARGRVHRVSKPYFQGTAAIDILWTTNSYDVLGRLTSVTLPDGGVESTAYNGLTTTLTNALTQTSVRVENALGELVSATDNLSNVTTYSYDSHGNLLETNAAGVITTMTYDIRGLKLTMDDPDMGDWSYAYNALGELTSQTDAKAQVTTMTYDLLGRMATRSEAEGTTTWTYDTAVKGIGKIHSVSAEDPALTEYYAEAMTYDSLGRPSLASVTLGGETYDTSTLYDTAGRADTLVYPSGFTVKSVFTARGHLAEITDSAGTLEYWRADTVNAEGQVTAETLGNGVTTTRIYDPATSRIDSISTVKPGAPATTIQDLAFDFDFIGNLTARRDLQQDREEAFTYDGLNRLTGTTLTDTATLATLTNTTYSYDSLGNITNKSDVGVYTYGTGAPGQPGPHAVVSAGTNNYTYDANGSMETGAGKTTTWTSFNKPGLIVDTLTSDETGFVYGPSRARITQQIIKGGLTTSVTYVGSHFEKKARFGEDDELVHYIRAGATIAIFTEYRDAMDAVTDSKTRYTHRDHLGSIASLTDELGAVTETLSYDPHGKRRLADWQAGSPVDPAETPRGFTGHEHLDAVGLIHMNGRVYDPTLGRFLSADPYVEAPETAQSFNRYSYIENNPLSYTDPSGFGWRDGREIEHAQGSGKPGDYGSGAGPSNRDPADYGKTDWEMAKEKRKAEFKVAADLYWGLERVTWTQALDAAPHVIEAARAARAMEELYSLLGEQPPSNIGAGTPNSSFVSQFYSGTFFAAGPLLLSEMATTFTQHMALPDGRIVKTHGVRVENVRQLVDRYLTAKVRAGFYLGLSVQVGPVKLKFDLDILSKEVNLVTLEKKLKTGFTLGASVQGFGGFDVFSFGRREVVITEANSRYYDRAWNIYEMEAEESRFFEAYSSNKNYKSTNIPMGLRISGGLLAGGQIGADPITGLLDVTGVSKR